MSSRETPIRIFPKDPPHKTSEEYVRQFGPDSSYIRRKKLEYDWRNGGMVQTWFSKSVISRTNYVGEVFTEGKCHHNSALVRGDGKILSPVNKINTKCEEYLHFAENVDGFLKGVVSVGMYEYK